MTRRRAIRRRANAFTPASFGASLLSWFRASIGVTVAGGKVTRWANAGSAGDALDNGGGPPFVTFNASDAAYSGAPSVQLDDAAGLGADGLVLSSSTASTYTVFFVARMLAASSEGLVFAFGDDGSGNNGLLFLDTGTPGTLKASIVGTGGGPLLTAAVTTGTPLARVACMALCNGASSTVTAVCGGASGIASGDAGTTALQAANALFNEVVGAGIGTASRVSLAEIVIVAGNQSAAWAAMRDYFALRFGAFT